VIVDTHMHLYADAEQGLFETGAYPITEYGDHEGVRFSARAGTVDDGLAALADELEAYNRWLCGLGVAHPELLPFVTVNPAVMAGDRAAAHVDLLLREHGARGMKLHPIAIRTHPDDPGLDPVFSVFAAAQAPVVVHCGPDARGYGWSLPRAFEPVVAAHPRLPLVLAHLGGARWSEIVAVAEGAPGLLFDLSEIVNWAGAPLAPSLDDVAGLVRAIGPHRVLMGSDFPWYDPIDTVRAVEALPGLARSERDGILGGNAARVLDLE
jgi:uncharacterized protein